MAQKNEDGPNIPVPKSTPKSEPTYSTRVDKGERDDQEFWKSKEFKDTVAQIKSPTFTYKPPVNPMNAILPALPGIPPTRTQQKSDKPPTKIVPRYHGTSFNTKLFENELDKTIRSQVTKSVMAERSMQPQSVLQDFIDQEVERVKEEMRAPRYIYLKDGRPFYTDRKAERRDLAASLIGENPSKKRLSMAMYDIANGMQRTLGWLGEPSVRLEEFASEDKPDVISAVARLGLNSLLLAGEYLHEAPYALVVSEDKINKLQAEVDALKYTDPKGAEALQATVDMWKQQYAIRLNNQDRMTLAERAVDESWKLLTSGEAMEHTKEEHPYLYYDFGLLDPENKKKMIAQEEKLRAERAVKEAEAKEYRGYAAQARLEGNYEKALRLTEQAIGYERESIAGGDPGGAYTWNREPERYEAFKTDWALAEMQMGRPLTITEIRRLKEMHVNGGTEFLGQVIFDPLNFIPSKWIETAVSVPARTIAKVARLTGEEIPQVKRAGLALTRPVRWLMRENVKSGANRIARSVYGMFERVGDAYTTAEDVSGAVDLIGDAILDAKRAGPNGMQAVYDRARKTIPGMENLTLKDFKSLTDASTSIEPTRWRKLYEDALADATFDLEEIARRHGKKVEDIAGKKGVEWATKRLAVERMSAEFHGAFVDLHRIIPGGNLTDDTLAGWVSKSMRELSGDETNTLLRKNGADYAITAYGKTLGQNTRNFVKYTNRVAEGTLHVLGIMRDVWSTVVLTTPRWIISNYLDTAMRSVVYGGDLFDDSLSLFSSTQRHFADQVGRVPMEFNQALARIDLDFVESVPSKLLYQDYKPHFGPLSWMAEEYKRLGREGKASKSAIVHSLTDHLPEGKLKGAMAWMGDGLVTHVRPADILRSVPGGISDFNTAIEFTFRLRMFHREYFKTLAKIEPYFFKQGISVLPDQLHGLARQLWDDAGGNPRRINAVIEHMFGKAKAGTPANWALLVPENLAEDMAPAERQLFIDSVRTQLDDWLKAELKAGRTPNKANIAVWFHEYEKEFDLEVQRKFSQIWNERDLNLAVDPNAAIAAAERNGPPEDITSLQGSLPVNLEENARLKAIAEATENVYRGKPGQPEDVVKSFETAVSDYAKVERVPGGSVRRTVVDGKPIIEIGDNVLKKGTSALYKELHETLIDAFIHVDEEGVLRGGFSTIEEYSVAVRRFIEKPAEVLADDEQKFLTIAQQFTDNGQLRKLIERTRSGKGRKINFDAEMEIYRDIGEYSDVHGFVRPPEDLLEAQVQKARALPGSVRQAAIEQVAAARELRQAITTFGLPEEAAVKLSNYVELTKVYRDQLHYFYTHLFPGPLTKSAKESTRKAGWELYYKLMEQEYLHETVLKKALSEQIINGQTEAALRTVDGAMEDFAAYFLKENGITLEWDKDMQRILRINVRVDTGDRLITRNYTDPAYLSFMQRQFYSPRTEKLIADHMDELLRAKNMKGVRNALVQVFDMPSNRAQAWANVIDSHAQKWAEVTKRPIDEYYQRLGFQRLPDGTLGLGTQENFRVVTRGAVQRGEEDTFHFYGLGQSNFETMVRETGELFYDDLVEMAKYNTQFATDLKNLNTWLSNTTGKPVRANKLSQVHSDLFADVFVKYVMEGSGPDISLKGSFEQMKGWLVDTYKGLDETVIADDISADIHRQLDRLFTENQVNTVPNTSKRYVKTVAKEAGVKFKKDADLLDYINQKMIEQNPPPAALTDAENNALTNEMMDLNNKLWDPATPPADLPMIRERLSKIDEVFNPVPAEQFKSLDEVPKNVVAQIFGTPKKPYESKIAKELQEGWEVWKTRRGIAGVPQDALKTPETFKTWLRQQQAGSWSEAASSYNRLEWELEQFQDAMLNYHTGMDYAEVIFPRVPEGQLSDGVKVWIRNQEQMQVNIKKAKKAMDQWMTYIIGLSEDPGKYTAIPKADQVALRTWGQQAAGQKAEMIDVLLHGGDVNGRNFTGAIDKVNHIMLDYQHRTTLDQMMSNFFPFWMFPSRSFPFWAETLATHPTLIAAYEKIQRLSRSQRYQARAMTSSGLPLPSLDGYIKMPGTDMWFNPLAPFSFRYVLDVAKSKDDVLWASGSKEDDVEPKAFLAKELMQAGQYYGFSLGPWAAWLFKGYFDIPDEVLPRYPLGPQIALIPRHFVYDLISKANKVEKFGVKGWGDMVYPEVPWHDYMVERRIYENTLAQLQSGTLSEAERMKLSKSVTEAIKAKGDNPIWKAAYEELSSEEATNAWTSFFTGFYPKLFTDGQAERQAWVNQLNLLKSSLNNEMQATYFDMPTDSDQAYDEYLNMLDTPEGWMARLYTDSGWVKDSAGKLLRNPEERAKALALKITQDENQQVYYDKRAALAEEYNKRLKALPVGATWEQTKTVYDWYSQEIELLGSLRTYERIYGSSHSVGNIMKDFTNDWFREVNSTMPRWEPEKGETYMAYQERVREWETRLPTMAPLMLRAFVRRMDVVYTLDALKDDQKLPSGFWQELVKITNASGFDSWQKENDDVFDGLNKAWKALYWNPYWETVQGKDGYEYDLAEKDFFYKHPDPPNDEEMYAWMTAYYGANRFTYEEVQKWLSGGDVASVQERQIASHPSDYQTRQDIWNMLSWMGPGSRNAPVFDVAFANAGGDPDWLTAWYQENGTAYASQPEILDLLNKSLKETMSTLGVKPPSRTDLVRWVQAQNENDTFRSLVTAEIGDGFFDWTDENGMPHQGLLSYYNNLKDYDAKREFRNSEYYAPIEDYYAIKEVFAEDHAVWAEFYGFDSVPSVGVDAEGESTLPLTGPGTTRPPTKNKKGGGGGKSVYRPTQPGGSTGSRNPYFHINSRTGSYLSPGLLKVVGEKMAWEITNSYSNNRPISASGKSFLRSVASRFPQYRQEINRVLSR